MYNKNSWRSRFFGTIFYVYIDVTRSSVVADLVRKRATLSGGDFYTRGPGRLAKTLQSQLAGPCLAWPTTHELRSVKCERVTRASVALHAGEAAGAASSAW